jgi:mRNA interferase MazF
VGVYVPAQGDFVVLTFDPQAGHEQMGRRPALVVSVDAFNLGTRMAICCPITNTNRRSPFHVGVPNSSSLTGFVMCEQVKSIDYRYRKVKFVEKSPVELLNEVLAVIDASLYPKP